MKCKENTSTNAQLALAGSMLNAFRLIEILIICANLVSLVSLAIITTLLSKLLAFSVLFFGIVALYLAYRIRVDAQLFMQWNHLDGDELDNAIRKITPHFTMGRSLELRLIGTYNLLKMGALLAILQYALLAVLFSTYTR